MSKRKGKAAPKGGQETGLDSRPTIDDTPNGTLIASDPGLADNRFYIPVYEDILEAFGMSVALVYGVIHRFTETTGDFRGSRQWLANKIRCSVSTVHRSLLKLKGSGLVDWHYRGNRTTIYRAIPNAVIPVSQIEPPNLGVSKRHTSGSQRTTEEVPVTHEQITEPDNRNKESVVAGRNLKLDDDPEIRLEADLLDIGLTKEYVAQVLRKRAQLPGLGEFAGHCLAKKRTPGWARTAIEGGWYVEHISSVTEFCRIHRGVFDMCPGDCHLAADHRQSKYGGNL